MLGSKPTPYRLPLIIVVGAIIVFAIAVGKPAPERVPDLPEPTPTVRTITLAPGTESPQVKSQGLVEPALKTVLVAQIAGRVDFVSDKFANGGEFVAGESLVQIERADYEIAMREAEANLADAQRALAVEKGAARQARREWRDLGSEDANALFLRKPQLTAAKANVQAAEARLKQAKLNLQRTTISAPYDGFVMQKAVDVGQFVAAGTRLGEVYAKRRFEIRLPLVAEERYLLGEAVGSRVDIYTQQLGRRLSWPGKIVRIESAIDSVSRQFYVVASIDEPYSDAANANSGGIPLSVGQFVQAKIAALPQPGVFRIPRSALRQPNRIWVIENGDQIAFYEVDIIYRDTSEAIISSGQLGSEKSIQLVISDLSVVRPGQRVKLSVKESDAGAKTDDTTGAVTERATHTT